MRGFLPRSIVLRVFLFMVVLVVFVEFLMFSYLGRKRIADYDTKLIKDYEIILCRLEMSPGLIEPEYPYEHLKPKKFCPSDGIVTAFKHWSLPSNMWVYANILAFSVTTTLRGYVPVCLKKSLGNVFTNLTIPILSTIEHCVIPLSESVSSLEFWDDVSQSIVISESELHGTIVMEYMDIACQQFVFTDALKDLAREYLLEASRSIDDDRTVVYIGVYITKSTIIINQEYDDLYPSVQFFLGAMDYFRTHYKNTIFVVISDRADIWQSIFRADDIFIVDENTVKEVGGILSILSHCNHTILSSSESALWAAILSGGETVLSVSLSEDFNNVIKHYKHWIYLANDSKVDNVDAMSFT